MRDLLHGKAIAQRTSAGTQGIVAASRAVLIFATALVTAGATARACLACGAEDVSLVAMGKNADLGNALLIGGQALAVQGQINYTRDMEREADRIGYGVATQAGFDTAPAPPPC